jgi:hypothetical protein
VWVQRWKRRGLVEARWGLIGERANTALSKDVGVDKMVSFHTPARRSLGTHHASLAVIDNGAVGQRWLRRSPSKVTDRRTGVSDVAEVIVTSSLLFVEE